MTDVDLDVVGDRVWGAFQKVGQAIIHQLHQKCWEASIGISINVQILDNIWVSYGAHTDAMHQLQYTLYVQTMNNYCFYCQYMVYHMLMHITCTNRLLIYSLRFQHNPNNIDLYSKLLILTLSTVTLKDPVVPAGGSGGMSRRPPRRLRLADPRLVAPWYTGPLSGSSLAGSLSFQLNTTRAVLACVVN